MRRGTTLLELLLVIVLLAVLAAIVVPRLAALADGAALRHETFRIVHALDAARGAGIRLGVPAHLVLDDSAYTVQATIEGATITAWRAPGAQASGTHLSGAGSALLFGPAGVALGASNRTLTLSKGSARRRIVVSRLGRLTY